MKKIKLVTKVIAIIIICLIGFVGIYFPWKKPLEMKNEIKDFSLGKDFTGYREIILVLSDANKVYDSEKKLIGDTDSYDDASIKDNKYTKSDEKVNSTESLTIDNYEKSKSIVEKRLKDLGVQEYNLSMDKESGKIYIQIPENSVTDRVVSNITEIGSVELKDSKDSSKVFLTSENFDKAKVMYGGSITTGVSVYLNIQFDKNGKNILKDLSENEYKTKEESKEEESEQEAEEESEEKNNEETDKKSEESNEEEQKEEQNKVALYMSGNEVTSTSFEEPVHDGVMSLRMGQVSTDSETVEQTAESASAVAAILNNGVMPLKYKVTENRYIASEIKTTTIRNILIAVAVVFALLLAYMIFKNKQKGVLAALGYVAFVSLYLILLREFNVTIAMEGIIGGIIVLALNYIMNMRLIKVKENKEYYQTYLDIIMKLIPILAISIIFIFMPVTALSSIGMVMFWGIVLSLIYNITITKHILN